MNTTGFSDDDTIRGMMYRVWEEEIFFALENERWRFLGHLMINLTPLAATLLRLVRQQSPPEHIGF